MSSVNRKRVTWSVGYLLNNLHIFLTYINDIANISDILQMILFADDTNLFAFYRNLNTLIQLVNRKLELLNTYSKVNKLSLNVDKTVFMVFTSARKNMMQMLLTIE